MGESIVSYAIKKLDTFLDAEVKLQRGLKKELVSLQNELASISVVLKDADRKAHERDDIKEWLRQVREMAYQIEDVMDEYLALQLNAQTSSVLVKAFRSLLELKLRHQLATTINDIKVELAQIQRRKDHYKLDSTMLVQEQKQGCQDKRGYFSTYMEDAEFFGNDKSRSHIITMLKMEHQPCMQFVIAIVGMGGLGKTSLVKKLYEDKEVRKHFGLYAWISVSQSYKKMDVLKSILKQLLKAASRSRNHVATHEVDGLPHDQVMLNLRNLLQEHQNQRYLLILDDVWDTELLNYIRDSLPSYVDGKIMITTRHRDVARTWTTSLSGHVHELQPLPPNEAWNLFCIKTFRNRACPQELEDLYRQIVDKCEGLPLAIVMIGGFLNTKQCDYSYLSKLLNSLGSEFTSNRELTRVKKILLLSYHELPSYLKPCYLYFGMLPKAYAIAHRRLIRIWMADGLVEPQRGKTREDIGEEYLIELIQRNLVQVASANPTGRHTCVRVHDILREIIISELEETGFGKLVSNANLSMINHFRRLTISSSNDNSKMLKTIVNGSKFRCFTFVSDNAGQEMPKTLTIRSLIKAVPLLKVLDLEDAPIHEIPEEVGNLGLLCLLNLRKTNVKTLPKSIGRLVNLETLDMRYCPIQELPKEMNHLHKLRYLHAYHSDCDSNKGVGVKIPTGVLKNLKDLQKLIMIEIAGETTKADAETIIEEVRELKELRKLGITFSMENRIEVSSMVQEKKHLESLIVKSASKNQSMDLELDGAKNPSLQCVYIFRGILHKLPHWIAQLNNLVSFGLKHSRLEEDPLPVLSRLPNLVQLYLMDDSYIGDQLGFGSISGFKKLQGLRIRGLKALYMIKGSPPPLVQQGFIFRCPKLKYVPSELQFLIWPYK